MYMQYALHTPMDERANMHHFFSPLNCSSPSNRKKVEVDFSLSGSSIKAVWIYAWGERSLLWLHNMTFSKPSIWQNLLGRLQSDVWELRETKHKLISTTIAVNMVLRKEKEGIVEDNNVQILDLLWKNILIWNIGYYFASFANDRPWDTCLAYLVVLKIYLVSLSVQELCSDLIWIGRSLQVMALSCIKEP